MHIPIELYKLSGTQTSVGLLLNNQLFSHPGKDLKFLVEWLTNKSKKFLKDGVENALKMVLFWTHLRNEKLLDLKKRI